MSTNWQADVRAFHKATGSTIGDFPELRDRHLRAKLIAEEACETISALGFPVVLDLYSNHHPTVELSYVANENLAKAMDGVADSIFVNLGTAVAAGVEMQPLWDAVVAANMAKATGPRREDGKILKPEGWRPPDIEGLIEQQAFRQTNEEADYWAGLGEVWEAAPI